MPMLSGGQELRGGGTAIKDIDPSYGQPLVEVSTATSEDVDFTVAAAAGTLADPSWRQMPPAERALLLLRLADLVERDGDLLAQLDSIDAGLPYADALHEVPAAVEDLRYYAGWATKLEGRTIPVSIPGYDVQTRLEPVGVCAAITSWNFPLEAFTGKVGPAIAAGNTIVLKPAEHAPLTSLWLGRLALEAGFPPGAINIVLGGAEVGAALVDHPQIAKVAFTGSTTVGRRIAAAAAEHLKRVSVELGGKSPVVICADADLDRAVTAAAESVFKHAGQNCVAGSRLIAHESIAEAVIEGLARHAREFQPRPAFEPEAKLGPVISRTRQEQILAAIEGATSDGGAVHEGGGTPEDVPDGGFYVQPTVISGLANRSQLASEEIFGPVVMVLDFDDLDQAIELANDTDYGLSASIWTASIAAGRRFAGEVAAGTIWINGHVLYDSAAPFGGVKASGFGRELGADSLTEYTQVKTVWMGD